MHAQHVYAATQSAFVPAQGGSRVSLDTVLLKAEQEDASVIISMGDDKIILLRRGGWRATPAEPGPDASKVAASARAWRRLPLTIGVEELSTYHVRGRCGGGARCPICIWQGR